MNRDDRKLTPRRALDLLAKMDRPGAALAIDCRSCLYSEIHRTLTDHVRAALKPKKRARRRAK